MPVERTDHPQPWSIEVRLRRKGIRILIGILALHFVLLSLYSLYKIQEWATQDLRVLADMISRHAATATKLGNATEAHAILATLQAKPDVLQAVILTADAHLLAEYRQSPAEHACPAIRPGRGPISFDRCGVALFAPIEFAGSSVGSVGIQIGIVSTYLEVLLISVVDLGLSVMLTLLSIPYWRRLAKHIAEPIGDLVAATSRATMDSLPHVTVRPHASREVVALCEGFNRMMIQLATQDRSLREELQHRQHAEQRLIELAYADPVTGLHNRHYFRQALDEAMQSVKAPGGLGALMYIDLDGFKVVNDTLGHDAGDMLLLEVGKRLRGHLREADVICRTGGDEFAVLIRPLSSPEAAQLVAEKLVRQLAAPYRIQNLMAPTVTASIGFALFPDDATDAGALMLAADKALYQAKAAGRCCHRRAEARAEKSRERQLMEDLPFALARGELFLVFQPKVTLQAAHDPTRLRAVSVEALLRWQHPRLGLIGPDQFIGFAESSGQILALGHWILQSACGLLVEWRSSIQPDLRLSVNLSPRQLADESAIDGLIAVLAASGLPPGAVELELTESAFVDRSEATLGKLNRLRAAGFGLSVDDFGTGYSSLAYLAEFPVTTLKLDRTFVDRISEDRRGLAIARAIIALARALELEVVAEGVETPEQASCLLSLDADLLLQGYLFAKPMNAPGLGIWLTPAVALAPQRASMPDHAAAPLCAQPPG